jgi:hypothetical protein
MTADASGWASLGAFVAALTLATGCGEPRGSAHVDPCANGCPLAPCLLPFTVTVTNAANQLVPNASATTPGLTCTADPGQVFCAAGWAEATYAVEVSAPGYVTKQVQVVVGPLPATNQCGCTGCATWEPSVVTLAPAP